MIQCSVWKEEDDYCKVDKRKCGKTNWYEMCDEIEPT